MSNFLIYDEDYFIRGKETGKSLYENYRWIPKLTIPMTKTIVDHCDIEKSSKILDFGCARGYLVKALRGLGYNAFGYDTSQWALDNADPEIKPYINTIKDIDTTEYFDASEGIPFFKTNKFDWVIAKDVLEHVEYVYFTIKDLMESAQKGLFVVVPLSKFDHGKYVVEEYEKDITHIHRLTLATWVSLFLKVGWKVEASYRVPGVKDNYSQFEMGNGFITCRRI